MPTNFRAISLTSTSLKIFETLLANRLSAWAESRSLFSFHQAGFRKNHSTHDHIVSLAAIQQNSERQNTFVAFIDLSKAFPSISRPLLLTKLEKLGISSKVMKIIAAMYQPDSYQFLLSQSTLGSQVGLADRGTREGSCLSPLLFLLFVSDLPSFLEKSGTRAPRIGSYRIRVLQFADDTALFAIGRVNLQTLLSCFEEYCILNGLTINGAKTEVINLRPRSRRSCKDVWDLAGSRITTTSHARYLGAIFGTGRKGVHHARHLRSRNLAKVLALVGRIRRGGITDTPFLLRLFRSLIVSSATYGAGLLLPFPIHHLSSQINCLLTTYLRSIWNLPRGTPNHFLLQVANLPCMTCECYFDAICFLLRKLSLWRSNSPLVETLIEEMFANLSNESWLSHIVNYLKDRVGLSMEMSSFDDFRRSLLMVDRESIRAHMIPRCHEFCFPPSASKAPYYSTIQLSSAPSWVCFSSSAPHYRFCRLFVSNCFRFSRFFSGPEKERECEVCHVPLNVDHYFFCPLRAPDRDFFFQGTGVPLSSPADLPRILRDPKLTIALEHVLSKFFQPALEWWPRVFFECLYICSPLRKPHSSGIGLRGSSDPGLE